MWVEWRLRKGCDGAVATPVSADVTKTSGPGRREWWTRVRVLRREWNSMVVAYDSTGVYVNDLLVSSYVCVMTLLSAAPQSARPCPEGKGEGQC